MTLRRKLLVYSLPVVLVVLLLAAKLISTVIAGNAAVSNFADSDVTALSDDVGTLRTLNIIEPAKAHFAAGVLAALEKRFDDADREFSRALAGTEHAHSCPARVNLALVRESLGDNAAAGFQPRQAVEQYLAAKQVVEQAPQGCFAGNTDTDEERRAVRADTLVRLDAKIAGVAAPPPPPPAAPPVGSVPAVPAPGSAPSLEQERRLNPGAGDPAERLRDILRDAAG
jgi:hypothetical protein